jgi:hypothetical protein
VVRAAKSVGLNIFAELTTFTASRYRARLRELRSLRDIFLIAHIPLLFKFQGGEYARSTFIHTFY